MDSAASQNAFDANIVNQHAITFNRWNNFVRLYGLCTHIRCIYLFIVIFITAEFQIILKHSEIKERPYRITFNGLTLYTMGWIYSSAKSEEKLPFNSTTAKSDLRSVNWWILHVCMYVLVLCGMLGKNNCLSDSSIVKFGSQFLFYLHVFSQWLVHIHLCVFLNQKVEGKFSSETELRKSPPCSILDRGHHWSFRLVPIPHLIKLRMQSGE